MRTSSRPTPGQQHPSTLLQQRYEDVKRRIREAARRSGRDGGEIILVAVTKTAAMDQVRELIELGHVDFGENRVLALVQRAAQLEEFVQRHRTLGGERARSLPPQIRWHMIGNLQRNKVRKLLGRVRLIHSVDSLRLAEAIQLLAQRLPEPVEILIQVNTSGERSKHGLAPAATRHLVEQLDSMMSLRPRGLMCMGPLTEDQDLSRRAFEHGHEIFQDICRTGQGGERFDILSMGMSSDFEVAVESGANVVRVGTAIFGPPSAPLELDEADDEDDRRRSRRAPREAPPGAAPGDDAAHSASSSAPVNPSET